MKCAFVTGAAAGIGRALAERFGRGGFRVAGIDADAEASEHTARELAASGLDVELAVADLASEAGITRACALARAHGPLDLVVHNAGVNHVAPFETSDLSAQRHLLEVNLVAPMRLSAEILRADALAPGATIVFVSSLSCQLGYPGAAVYAASKDGLTAYARSLAPLARRRGARVLTVFPGPTRTDHARRHAPPGTSLAAEAKRMPPEELAERVWRAWRSGRRNLVPGAANRALALGGRLFPRLAERGMRRAIFERLGPAPQEGRSSSFSSQE